MSALHGVGIVGSGPRNPKRAIGRGMTRERLNFYHRGFDGVYYLDVYPTPRSTRDAPPSGMWARVKWTVARVVRRWRAGLYESEARQLKRMFVRSRPGPYEVPCLVLDLDRVA